MSRASLSLMLNLLKGNNLCYSDLRFRGIEISNVQRFVRQRFEISWSNRAELRPHEYRWSTYSW